jgi:phage protein D
MAMLGQLRLSPSGRVLGLDANAALTTARARGYDEATVSVLLQEAEAVLVHLLNETPENHG